MGFRSIVAGAVFCAGLLLLSACGGLDTSSSSSSGDGGSGQIPAQRASLVDSPGIHEFTLRGDPALSLVSNYYKGLLYCGRLRVYRNDVLIFESEPLEDEGINFQPSGVHFRADVGDVIRVTVENTFGQDTPVAIWPVFLVHDNSGVSQPISDYFSLDGYGHYGNVYDRSTVVTIPEPEFEVRNLSPSPEEFDQKQMTGLLSADLIANNMENPTFTWTLDVKNESGEVVRAFSGTGPQVRQPWDGRNEANELLPDGTYTWEVHGMACEGESGGETTGSATGEATGSDISNDRRIKARTASPVCLMDVAESMVGLIGECSIKIEMTPDAGTPSTPRPIYDGAQVQVEPDGFPDGTTLNQVRLPVVVRVRRLPMGMATTDVSLRLALAGGANEASGHLNHPARTGTLLGHWLETGETTFVKRGLRVGDSFRLTFVPSEFAGNVRVEAACGGDFSNSPIFIKAVQVKKGGLTNLASRHAANRNRYYFLKSYEPQTEESRRSILWDGIVSVGGGGADDNESLDPNGTFSGGVGDLVNHPRQHYGPPALVNSLFKLAADYQKETGQSLLVNDMALPLGGRFDVGPDASDNTGEFWTGSHHQHRGDSADVNTATYMNVGTDSKLLYLAGKHGMSVIQESSHPHLILSGVSQ